MLTLPDADSVSHAAAEDFVELAGEAVRCAGQAPDRTGEERVA